MHADQLVPAVVATVAVLCLLIAGPAAGQAIVPAAGARGGAAAGLLPGPPGQSVPDYFPQQPKAERSEQTTGAGRAGATEERAGPRRDQAISTAQRDPTAEPPAMLTSPETWEKPWTPFVPQTPAFVPKTPAYVPKTP
ncbi:hypothetical protein ZWY2020_051787 [Hordeum vulgare]|nr:hypothetical protein ZWY2020_051787 [Hordeum vulgare]